MTDTTSGSETCGALAKALTAAQAEMKNPPKDSVNPHFKSRYADLATVRDAVIPVLNRHGLSVVQLPCEVEAGAALRTVLLHESGEWLGSTMLLRATKSDPQGIGSAITYARRFSLQAIAGVAADDDDDGQAGSREAKPAHQQPKPAASAPQQAPAQQPQQPQKLAIGEGNSVADMAALLIKVAEAKRMDSMAVWNKLRAANAWPEVPTFDDLRVPQLQKACNDLRATLKNLNGGAK